MTQEGGSPDVLENKSSNHFSISDVTNMFMDGICVPSSYELGSFSYDVMSDEEALLETI